MPHEIVNNFKLELWQYFGIQSDNFQHDRDYEQYLRIAIALKDIFETLYGPKNQAIVFSHEYMGMASALAFEIAKQKKERKDDITIFYAHEVSTARMVVENHPGHDFTFYNILNFDRDVGFSLEDEFGSYSHYSRNELVKKATNLNYFFAVSDLTKEEFLFLCPHADQKKVKVVYNGIPTEDISYRDKEKSRKLVQKYCENLYNFSPDYIFTHVARLIVSKGFWRDISFLYYLDEHFAAKGLKGFFIILSTLVGNGRHINNIRKMEGDYGWPVVHREGWPDLIGAEVDIYKNLELFNARSMAIKGVFINQFGFSKESCGDRMPDGMSLLDLRAASDIEFGLSVYEPFGIAQLETLPYGGIPMVSRACGCASLLKKNLKDDEYLCIDFSRIPGTFIEQFKTKHDFMNVDRGVRDQIEREICREAVPRLTAILPKNDRERKTRFKDIQKRSHLFDWDHITRNVIEHI
ncbi:hypothetical protein KKA47_00850 [bacterium]|nr:hypothetical protein [bacterium]